MSMPVYSENSQTQMAKPVVKISTSVKFHALIPWMKLLKNLMNFQRKVRKTMFMKRKKYNFHGPGGLVLGLVVRFLILAMESLFLLITVQNDDVHFF